MTEHDRRRLRAIGRTAAAGPLVGGLAAAAVGLAGGGGRGGLAVLLLCSAGACIVAAVLALVQATVDEYRREPVALRRIGWAAGLVVATLLFLVLLGGVAASS